MKGYGSDLLFPVYYLDYFNRIAKEVILIPIYWQDMTQHNLKTASGGHYYILSQC